MAFRALGILGQAGSIRLRLHRDIKWLSKVLTSIYTNTVIIPAGTPVKFAYLYGVDSSQNGGPGVNENTNGINHNRVLRSTGFNPYVMPSGYVLQSGMASHYLVHRKHRWCQSNDWIGGSGEGSCLLVAGSGSAHICRSKTNLVSGVWLDIPATDGTNWTSGSSTTNGFMSVTNWPSSGNTFFRLVKP